MATQNFILGTAQLGLKYGIANKNACPDQTLATEIVRVAWENGIREFDTAQGYGRSEIALGRAFAKLGISKKARVTSKPHPSLNHLDRQALAEALEGTLKNLGIQNLYALVLHRESFLPMWDNGLAEILGSFTASGRVKKKGISIYSVEAALKAINTKGIDIIQVPANIFDRRFEKAGVFQKARKAGKEIYIRSIFLQGLLLLDPDELPKSMIFAAPHLKRFKRISQELNMSPQELALAYVRTKIPQAKVIIGAENPEQITGNCLIWERKLSLASIRLLESEFVEISEKIINPTLWKNEE